MWRHILIGAAVLLAIGAGWGGWIWAMTPGHFPLEEIQFQGAEPGTLRTNLEQASRIAGVARGVNLLTINPRDVRERLLVLPWVRNARVMRMFPSRLRITLQEKHPVCMGREGDQLILLDEYAQPIKPLAPEDALIFPVITPPKKRDPASDVVRLVNFLARHPWFGAQVAEAVGFVGGRWVFYTHRGVKLLMPENMEAAITLLKGLQKKYQILDRAIRQVDLRVDGLAAVQPLPS
jgi:cell division protein FtsQ